MKLIYKSTVFLTLFLFFAHTAWAQPTKVRGQITDAVTKESIPFATIIFNKTSIGTNSDFEGRYFLETRENVDSITVSYIGYKKQTIAINKNGFKTIDVALVEDMQTLGEVVITPGENPAHRIVRGMIANKKKNNPERNNSYQYDSYNKMELSLTNIDERFKKRRLFRDFQFIFNYVDTSAVTGKAYLPFLISENVSEVYHSNNPLISKEIIKGSKISGFDGNNTSVAQFTGEMYQKFNIYDNYIELFKKGFVSPLNTSALMFYRFYLTDSTEYKNRYSYNLSFKPRNPKDFAFTGSMWVTADDFAVVDIQMRVNNKVNVNFINDVLIDEEFQLVNDSIWFWKQRDFRVDFTLSESDSTKMKGFLGHSSVHYSNVRFNEDFDRKKFRKLEREALVSEEALHKDETYWEAVRPYELSATEKGIYEMVDSVKNVPIYRTIVDVINTAVTGYYEMGKIEIGPYSKLLSFNDIEGTRFQIGGRTTSKLTPKIQLFGHIAYGTEDKEVKYKGGLLYKFSDKNKLWEATRFYYSHDMVQLGKSDFSKFKTDNILGSLLSRGSSDKLTMINDLYIDYEKEWIANFSNKIGLQYRKIIPSTFVPFPPKGTSQKTVGVPIVTKEISLNTRWAPKAKVLRRTFSRRHISSRLPIFNLDLTLGTGDYDYKKASLSLEHTIPTYPIGHTYYFMKAGVVSGEVPFPLLHLHEGNQTYVYDRYTFNMMNYYEFVSDRYFSLNVEHHFMGFFMNRIPLLKHTKGRFVASGRALWGSLSKTNNARLATAYESALLFPEGLMNLDKPYFEAGVGIENIFRFIRVDAVWRLSHLDKRKDIDKFGIRATLQLSF